MTQRDLLTLKTKSYSVEKECIFDLVHPVHINLKEESDTPQRRSKLIA